jgi:hypothetical protein
LVSRNASQRCVPKKEQKNDHDDPFYVHVPDHLMGKTQVLECSRTQLLDAENKIASDSYGTMAKRKQKNVFLQPNCICNYVCN